MSGQSIKGIAEAEDRDIKTVKRIITSQPAQERIQELKDIVLWLGQRAILNLHMALDPRRGNSTLAYKILVDLGVITERDKQQQYSQPGTQGEGSEAQSQSRQERLELAFAEMLKERH